MIPTLSTEEMWTEVEAYYSSIYQKFNFKPKPKDIEFLYYELQKFKKTSEDLQEKRLNRNLNISGDGKK